MGILSEDGSNPGPLLDIGTITDNINTLGSDEGVRVDDETVSTAKAAVEGSVPNINPQDNVGVTPLEPGILTVRGIIAQILC